MAQQPTPIPVKTPELEALFQRQGGLTASLSGCLIWNGHLFDHGGYGRFYVPELRRVFRAHRVAYAWKYGDTELILDHRCHDPLACQLDERGYCEHRRCCNPDHLEPTTRGENVRRGLPGSPLWNPVGNSNKTHCDRGHEFTPENTYINPRGERQCRKCMRAATDRYQDANRAELNRRRRERQVKVAYGERECAHPACSERFVPLRASARFCKTRACVLRRQREQRAERLSR